MAWIAGDKYPFTRQNVDRSPEGKGVYGLVKDANETIVYIGRGNIRERLQAHFNGDNDCITEQAPTHYYREVCSNSIAREKELLRAYRTLCNEKIG
jgi:excinuclease UvrABC nuclease subunit